MNEDTQPDPDLMETKIGLLQVPDYPVELTLFLDK